MTPLEIVVTPVEETDTDRLDPAHSQFATLVLAARRAGLLDEVKRRLRLQRKGGYQGIDIFLFALAFFGAQQKSEGFHGFADRTKDVGPKLMAMAGRDRWPTQASVSRALACVEDGQARQFSGYLLRQALDLSSLLHHDAVANFDACNRRWHLFDFDPTRMVSRQRALPEGEDLPEPKRASQELGEQGYSGRNRGDMVVSRPTLQHRGSRLWCGLDIYPGSGHWQESVEAGFAGVEELADAQRLDPSRCLMCIDGEQGGWTQVRAGLDSPVSFLTRLAVYSVLERREVRQQLDRLGWQEVADAKSGPKRQAAEFGTELIGQTDVRLVISRFRVGKTQSKRGAGIVVDGWQYEVFATDVDCKAWSAADIVELYYGRAGQENYFALEDRELELDRTFSDNPGGQLLVWTIGLWLWNLQLFMGWQSRQKTPGRSDSPVERDADVFPQTPEEWPEDDDSRDRPVIPDDAGAVTQYWIHRLHERPGWHWDPDHQLPVCPAGHHLRRHDVRALNGCRAEVRFRAKTAQCRSCPVRARCTSSTAAGYRKEITFAVPTHHVPDSVEAPDALDRDGPLLRPTWTPPTAPVETGPVEPRPPILKPQVLRRAFKAMCWKMRTHIVIDKGPAPEPVPEFYATSRSSRQRRRKTWTQKMAWNALQVDDEVELRIAAPPPLRQILDGPLRHQKHAVAS